MTTPNLLFPADTTIETIDKGSTAYDSEAREPIGGVQRTTVAVKAQRRYASVGEDGGAEPTTNSLGSQNNIRGRYVFRMIDLSNANYTVKRGDKVVDHGGEACEHYITHTEGRAHYESGPTLLFAYFSDRRPATTSPNDV